MLPIDILLNIALYTKFKQTISIMGCCNELYSYRKELYKNKQLLNNSEVIDLWSPEKDYYASTTKFMIARFEDELKFYTALYQLSNNIEKFLINNRYELFNVKLSKPWVCIWRHSSIVTIKYYDSLNDIKLDYKNMNINGTIINLKKSSPCWARWESNLFLARGIIEKGTIIYN
jgi:hypothetical protein